MGPMFRRERPQAGRYRQFHQIDAEAFGFEGPDIDAEIILLSARLLRRLGLTRVKLVVNSLGTPAVRAAYREQLIAYFGAHQAALDEDSRRRLHGNPLRILDSKNPELQRLIAGAPSMLGALDAESKAHFEALCAHIASAGIEYQIEPRLVRGLDYYTRTVFEWTTDALGAQDAVCSGGRYDGLIAQLGGDPTPGVGFAMGVERAVELLVQAQQVPAPASADVYIVVNGARAAAAGPTIVERLRDELPRLRFELNLGGGNFKTQFRRADRSGAALALIIGDDELARGVVGVKPLRQEAGQIECPIAELAAGVTAALGH